MKPTTMMGVTVCALLLFACSGEKTVQGSEAEELRGVGEPMLSSIMEGYNKDDYAAYSKDFDEKMKSAMSEKVFRQTRGLIMGKIGTYQSSSFDRVTKKGLYWVLYHKGKFEKENEVEIKVVLAKYPEGYKVSGLWFNSPKLRK